MTPVYDAGGVQIYQGDCRAVLATLPAESVQCVVTSPPYYGLRRYAGLPDSTWADGWVGQLGNEPTVALYLDHLLDVFRAVKRVLRPDGTAFINLGDGYEDKNLNLVPEHFAIAAQQDGWYVRSRVVWAKTSAMPESVQDRPTSAHETIWLLAKNPKYFYDSEAVKVPQAIETLERASRGNERIASPKYEYASDSSVKAWTTSSRLLPNGANLRNVWLDVDDRADLSDLWVLGPEPYKDAHFATFPTAIPKRAILAGTSERGQCPQCGAPWRRVTDGPFIGDNLGKRPDNPHANGSIARPPQGAMSQRWTVGWQPSCSCAAPVEFRPDDLEIISTPTGSRSGDDPTMETGRKGLNRPRGDGEGVRPITRYEQRKYAEQLKASPHRQAMADESLTAFDHYVRTDRSGARPIPHDLLESWIDRGWLERVTVPTREATPAVPQVVLDPFLGSGTTASVARALGRRCIGIEASAEYVKLAIRRIDSVPLHLSAATVDEAKPEQLALMEA